MTEIFFKSFTQTLQQNVTHKKYRLTFVFPIVFEVFNGCSS